MDSTFRLDLRELNEQNARRFEARLDQRTAELRTEMANLAAKLRSEMAALRQEMTSLKADLIKWMFLFWIGTVATMIGFGRVLLTG